MRRTFGAVRRLNRDSLPQYTRLVVQMAALKVSTLGAYFSAAWWGVALGRGNRFVGAISFVRTRGSIIVVGSKGLFLSTSTSNRHGLNRSCMLTTLRPGAEIRIGQEVGFSGAVICAAKSVVIGDRVMLGANVTVTDTDSHPVDFRMRHPIQHGMPAESAAKEISSRPVFIGEDAFIGMHSLVLKGVTIGAGTVVGAGSVVTHDLPSYCVAAGNPARVIRMLMPGEMAQ